MKYDGVHTLNEIKMYQYLCPLNDPSLLSKVYYDVENVILVTSACESIRPSDFNHHDFWGQAKKLLPKMKFSHNDLHPNHTCHERGKLRIFDLGHATKTREEHLNKPGRKLGNPNWDGGN